MAKIRLPKVIKYICQDIDGEVNCSFDDCVPYINKEDPSSGWLVGKGIYNFINGEPNPNWRDTLIDLKADDYDYTDGILTRIAKK